MTRRGVVVIAIVTAGFALALALRDRIDPWVSTASVGALAVGLSWWVLGARARILLATSWRGALGAFGLGVLLVVATHAVYRGAAAASPRLDARVLELYASVVTDLPRAPLVGLTLMVVLAEELVWRGVAIAVLGPARPWRTGVTAVALYALPQVLAGAWLLVLAAVGLGSLFAAQRLRTGRVADPLITHAVWSLSIFVVFPLT